MELIKWRTLIQDWEYVTLNCFFHGTGDVLVKALLGCSPKYLWRKSLSGAPNGTGY